MAANPVHQVAVAFSTEPSELKLYCANAACLVALKQAAFGRTRPADNLPVERDYHDVYLLVSTVAAARQVVRLRVEPSQRTAEANVRRAANRLLRRLPV
jgi:hypothetical protein